MQTKRNLKNKRDKTRHSKSDTKWVTAFSAAKKSYKKTGSFNKARAKFRMQALSNVRKLFGALPQKNM
jgi:hypothetical protein